MHLIFRSFPIISFLQKTILRDILRCIFAHTKRCERLSGIDVYFSDAILLALCNNYNMKLCDENGVKMIEKKGLSIDGKHS